jgi:hypothetical protein
MFGPGTGIRHTLISTIHCTTWRHNRFPLIARPTASSTEDARMLNAIRPRTRLGRILTTFFFAADKDHVDGEVHAESVNRFTRRDPQALAGREGRVLQQPGASFGANIGEIGAVGQQRAASNVGHSKFRHLDSRLLYSITNQAADFHWADAPQSRAWPSCAKSWYSGPISASNPAPRGELECRWPPPRTDRRGRVPFVYKRTRRSVPAARGQAKVSLT